MQEFPLKPEILIIGAGPGGSSAAWALAQAGHDVLMIDKSEFPRDKTCGDGLPPLAIRTLHQMGLIDKVLEAGATRIDYIRITGMMKARAHMAIKDFKETDAEYALTIPRFRFDDVVRQHAVEAGAQFVSKVKVTHFDLEGDKIVGVNATTPDGKIRFEPHHVIIAVGAHMALLRTTGVHVKKQHMLMASRAYYEGFVPEDRFYYDFYFDYNLMPGYGWIFPSDDGTANIGVGSRDVWWNKTGSMRSEVEMFVERRKKQGVLNEVTLKEAIKGFPIRFDFQRHPIAGENWVTIGEAAGLVNPLTGEGIDLAMISGLIAGRTIHNDIGNQRKEHTGYQREVWEEFGPMFAGIAVLRDIIVNPLLMEYTLWLCTQHKFFAKTIYEIAQGLAPAQDTLHPIFVMQFFLPISPKWALEQVGRLAPRIS